PYREIYTLSLHDALPILDLKRWSEREQHAGHSAVIRDGVHADDRPFGRPQILHHPATSCDEAVGVVRCVEVHADRIAVVVEAVRDRKSTRLNSSHRTISY